MDAGDVKEYGPMQVIPVIDLMGGNVVRGIGGRRDEYRPIESQLAADARPETVAAALAARFGFRRAYVADLDAIRFGRPDLRAWQAISAAGLDILLDAGIGRREAAAQITNQLAAVDIATDKVQLVIGLETLEQPLALWQIIDLVGADRVYFSLDLKNGKPLVRIDDWRSLAAADIAHVAADAGIKQMIVLDLADVGTGRGTATIDLCSRLKTDFGEEVRLIAGGGVRGLGDLQQLTLAGCDAALVASALHDGRLTAEHIEIARRYQSDA